jgi:thymidine phosphorylase
MRELGDAQSLARTMLAIGEAHGKRVVALLTAMDRPLGFAVGNALEVEESVLTLRGEGPADLRELVVRQAAEMLVLGGAAPDVAAGEAAAAAALADGRAAARFERIVTAQGGNAAIVEDPALLPQAPVQRVLTAPREGMVGEMDVRAIGNAAVDLGAGRRALDALIDPAVGFHITAKPGQVVASGEPLATVHARDGAAADRALAALAAAMPVGDTVPAVLPLVVQRLTTGS